MNIILSAFSLLLLSTSGLGANARAQPPTVTVKNGTLIGSHNQHYDQDFFLGIPYAQAPVGELRFRQSEPVNESWQERPAKGYGAWCHSAPLSLPGFDQEGLHHEESEDCLTLNVIRPSGLESLERELPVLVWIHGGGLREGGSADQRYNMSFLVQESVDMGTPIIGVSFNYRLSGFGFLQGRAVNESGVANIGLYDQRQALVWIQENIAAFRGDPSRVTIQGESSGAVSVGHHFLAFGGRDDGLFRAGIAESGGPLSSSALLSLDQQDALYDNVLNVTDCSDAADSLQCLRSAPAEDLKAAFQGVNYYPVEDGGMIEGLFSEALEQGRFVKHPLLIGTNTNEGSAFSIPSALGINNSVDFREFVQSFDTGGGLSQESIREITAQYVDKLSVQDVKCDLGTVLLSPSPAYGSLYGKVTLYIGDMMFNAGRRYSNRIWTKYGVPSYSYRFDAVPNGINPQILGATHFQEISFVFRNFDGVGYAVKPFETDSTILSHEYHSLAVMMSRMWLSFTTTQSPNFHRAVGSNLTWPTYSHGPTNMVFRLNGSHLEADTWRNSELERITEAYRELRV